ncbi:MAG: CRISPR system precrRNA processing endoribonuclease RAMP protein Cas6 [Acidobacteria bacterium]|nr:CRISPR system precrRNA processing endoribonuclease RAMP protein Cas6 [Acidobacteriota bacterium]
MQLELAVLPLPADSSTPNARRGQFGNLLYHYDRQLYDECFSPSADTGPSGLQDRPRPFVLRPRALHIFSPALVPRLAGLLDVQPQTIRWPLDPLPARRLRVEFVTPTELKQNGAVLHTPNFAALAARARDRVLSLLAFYQNEATDEVDFAALAAQAAAVTETAQSIRFHAGQTRRSVRNQNIHSIGGFEGWAEYSGPLDALTPYLIAAQWTGVGRQTVWGKGEIRVTVLPFEECSA